MAAPCSLHQFSLTHLSLPILLSGFHSSLSSLSLSLLHIVLYWHTVSITLQHLCINIMWYKYHMNIETNITKWEYVVSLYQWKENYIWFKDILENNETRLLAGDITVHILRLLTFKCFVPVFFVMNWKRWNDKSTNWLVNWQKMNWLLFEKVYCLSHC